jgi:hypothetical protein
MRRLRPADWAAGLLAIVVGVGMSLPFQGVDRASGWASVGWAGVVVVVLAIIGGAGIWLTIALGRAPSVQVITATGATVAAAVAAIVTVIEAAGAGDGCYGRWVVAAAALLLAVASWRSMADERTDVADSAYAPPPARPAPPA